MPTLSLILDAMLFGLIAGGVGTLTCHLLGRKKVDPPKPDDRAPIYDLLGVRVKDANIVIGNDYAPKVKP